MCEILKIDYNTKKNKLPRVMIIDMLVVSPLENTMYLKENFLWNKS